MKNKTVLDEIFVLKGAAITGLIVLHTYLPVINASFHNALLKIIGSYAMPIFMFSSGFLFGFSRLKISSLPDYKAFVMKKFKRLMIPYFTIWGLYITAEFSAEFFSGFTSLDYSVDRSFWKYILFYPSKGTALHLWFMYHLFFVFLSFPLLKSIFRSSLLILFLIFLFYIIPVPQFSFFNHGAFRQFLLIFYLGYLYSHIHMEIIIKYSKYLCVLLPGILIILSNQKPAIADTLNLYMNSYTANKLFSLLMTFLGIIFYYNLTLFITRYKLPSFSLLKHLGIYSVAIYLFHHGSLVMTRIILINVLQFSSEYYPFLSIIIFISGIIFPVMLAKHIIFKSRILSSSLLGAEKASIF
jgi:fucose 4-O-acetylase-like acetyltransferase